MESNENKILDKAEFYRANEIVAHVLTIPKGTFRNGRFTSELIDGKFFWFIAKGEDLAKRLFLSEIYDIEDYIEEDKNEVEKENET